MNYRSDRYGNQLSILGFGCMRFPKNAGIIDMAQTERQILAAIDGGVNYFDTAYIYPGSEAALGEILERNHIRDRVYIATKLPHYLIKNRDGLEKLFAEELRRLRTDHVDYYLMHMLTDTESWNRLKALGIEDWLREKKESGAIRQVGFSYHATAICSAASSMPGTGTSARSSTTTWTSIPRPDAGACTTPTARAFPW